VPVSVVMADWVIEALDQTHERQAFRCGKPSLDAFLHNLVSQYEKRRLGKTYVALARGEKKVLGYYTLASGAIAFKEIPVKAAKKLPRHSVPVALLARLAVDDSAKGQGLGKMLLIDALQRCVTLSEQLGIHAVEVDAIDEEAKAFYEKFGFVALNDGALHLYLPMTTIISALK
jgi:GNAT superfamily N-acetyltransferase